MAYKHPAVNGSVPARPPRVRGPKRRNIWKEISFLFAIDLLVGAAVWIVLYLLGVAPQSLWFLFSLSVISYAVFCLKNTKNKNMISFTRNILIPTAEMFFFFSF